MQPESHIHTPKSAKMCENEPTHSQLDSHLENWNPNGLLNFQIKRFEGSKLIGLKSSLYNWKVLGT